MKIKIRPGVAIMIMGLCGLVFGLASDSLSMIEKIPITIICFGIMILGILIECPKVSFISADPVEQETFFD